MKKSCKMFVYLIFFFALLLGFNDSAKAEGGLIEGNKIAKECIYQYGVKDGDHVSSLKFNILNNGNTESVIIYYDGKGVNNIELSTNWKDAGLDKKYEETKRCPNFAMVAKNWNGYHVFLSYNEKYLEDVAKNEGYSNYFIEPLIDYNDAPNKPSNNQAYTSEEIENSKVPNNNTDKNDDENHLTTDSSEGCEALGPLLNDLQLVWDIIKIAAPILVVVFGSVDFAQVVISNDNDAMKKATGKFTKRLIFAGALFFLPYLIDLLFAISGLDKTITSAVCGIR